MTKDLRELTAEEIAAVAGGTGETAPPEDGRGGKYVLAGG